MSSFEQYIARRYLSSKRTFGFVSLLSAISVGGITIGVAALIVVLSVFNGFNTLVTSLLTSFDPHLRVESIHQDSQESYDSLVTVVGSLGGVEGVSPFIQGKALVIRRNVTRVVNIKGIEAETFSAVSGLREKMVLGNPALNDEDGHEIVVGMALADRLGVVVGDTIALVSPSSAASPIAQLGIPLIRRFRLSGMYETNNKDYDAYYAFVSIESAARLFQTNDNIDGVDIRLDDIQGSSRAKSEIEDVFGGRYRILTWYDLHRELYTVMQVERWSAYIILMLIVAVASFNLLGSLTMTVIEKTRDIGVLKAMGATTAGIRKVFLYEGLFVGLLGTAFGLGLGLLVVWLQQAYHLFPLDPTVYIIAALPVEVRWYDLVVVGVASIGLALIAARSPAKRAAHLIPVEAIRWE